MLPFLSYLLSMVYVLSSPLPATTDCPIDANSQSISVTSYQASWFATNVPALTVVPTSQGIQLTMAQVPADWHGEAWQVEVQVPAGEGVKTLTWDIPYDQHGLRATQWDQPLSQPGTYWLRVSGCDARGSLQQSEWVEVSWEGSPQPKAYWCPNRALMITLPLQEKHIEAQILDMQGRVLHAQVLHHRHQLTLPTLPEGIHLVRVKTPDGVFVMRIPPGP